MWIVDESTFTFRRDLGVRKDFRDGINSLFISGNLFSIYTTTNAYPVFI